MAITKIQKNAFPSSIDLSSVDLTIGANEIVTANIADTNVTHAKLHTDMDLSSKTVTLPSGATLGSSTNGLFNIQGGSTTSPQIRFFDGGTARARIGVPTGQTYLSLSGSDTLTADVVIKSDGNVGIGTSTPLAKLHANDTASAFYMGYGGNQDIYLQTTNGSVIFTDYNASNERMRINPSGNVGIGTGNPSGKLHAYTAADDQLLYGSNPRLWLTTPTGINGLRVYGDTTPMEFKINSGTYNGAQFSMGSTADLSLIGRSASASTTYTSSPAFYLNAMKWNGSANVTSFQGSIRSHLRSDGSNDGYLGLGANANANHLVIDASNGNVGIGANSYTTSPQGLLHVESTTTHSDVKIFKRSGDNAHNASLMVGYDENACLHIYRPRANGTIYINHTQNDNIVFQFGGANRYTLDTNQFTPNDDAARDLGSSTNRWNNVYTTDLHLSNKGKQNEVDGTWGDWTLQEGENDIFMINHRTGKKYKMMLSEVK